MVDIELLKPERIRPLKVDEYERLAAAGAFEDEHVELLRGVLVEMTVQGPKHAWVTSQLGALLTRAVSRSFQVRQHSPFHADNFSMPEPDIAVVKTSPRPIHPRQALLLVEVADSSLPKDREIKREIYAEAGVPEYWIVEIRRDVVHVWTRPRGGVYTTVVTLGRTETLTPVALRGVEIPVDDVFPPRRRRRPVRRARR